LRRKIELLLTRYHDDLSSFREGIQYQNRDKWQESPPVKQVENPPIKQPFGIPTIFYDRDKKFIRDDIDFCDEPYRGKSDPPY
jgi:hypothetical protein